MKKWNSSCIVRNQRDKHLDYLRWYSNAFILVEKTWPYIIVIYIKSSCSLLPRISCIIHLSNALWLWITPGAKSIRFTSAICTRIMCALYFLICHIEKFQFKKEKIQRYFDFIFQLFLGGTVIIYLITTND